MQTFLPYDSFYRSLACLDNKRLGKQRVEALQIYKALTQKGYGWQNHPAVHMWRGFEDSLKFYHNLAIKLWISRGFNNTMSLMNIFPDKRIYPSWMGDERLHSSHRANLLRKDFSFYSKYKWIETPKKGYFWPC